MSTELNLLPPDRRRVLTRQLVWESLRRVFVSLAVGLGVVTLVGGAIIGILQFMAWSTALGTQAEFDQALVHYKELRDTIAAQNVLLTEMNTLSRGRTVWSQLVPSVVAAFPPGITLKTIEANAPTRKLSLSGTALARSTLIVLTERLKILPWVEEVKAPLSNFVQRENPTFQFELLVKKDITASPSPSPSP